MTKIPTAEEFSKDYSRLRSAMAVSDLTSCMIEFAKLHVEATLKAASEKVIMLDTNEDCHIEDDEGNCPDFYVIDKTSILEAYPLDQIK